MSSIAVTISVPVGRGGLHIYTGTRKSVSVGRKQGAYINKTRGFIV
jgi:hypothetical protein